MQYVNSANRSPCDVIMKMADSLEDGDCLVSLARPLPPLHLRPLPPQTDVIGRGGRVWLINMQLLWKYIIIFNLQTAEISQSIVRRWNKELCCFFTSCSTALPCLLCIGELHRLEALRRSFQDLDASSSFKTRYLILILLFSWQLHINEPPTSGGSEQKRYRLLPDPSSPTDDVSL